MRLSLLVRQGRAGSPASDERWGGQGRPCILRFQNFYAFGDDGGLWGNVFGILWVPSGYLRLLECSRGAPVRRAGEGGSGPNPTFRSRNLKKRNQEKMQNVHLWSRCTQVAQKMAISMRHFPPHGKGQKTPQQYPECCPLTSGMGPQSNDFQTHQPGQNSTAAASLRYSGMQLRSMNPFSFRSGYSMKLCWSGRYRSLE